MLFCGKKHDNKFCDPYKRFHDETQLVNTLHWCIRYDTFRLTICTQFTSARLNPPESWRCRWVASSATAEFISYFLPDELMHAAHGHFTGNSHDRKKLLFLGNFWLPLCADWESQQNRKTTKDSSVESDSLACDKDKKCVKCGLSQRKTTR